MPTIRLLLALILCVNTLTSLGWAAVGTIQVADAAEVSLKGQLAWRVDYAQDPATVADSFLPYRNETFSNKPVWLRFALQGTNQVDAARYLQVDAPRVREVSVWTRLEGSDWQPIMHHGVHGEIGLSANSRPGAWLPRDAGPVEVAVRMYDKATFSPELRLFNAERLNDYSRGVMFAETIGFGLLLALFFYAGISLFVVRDSVYLYMGGYCLASVLLVAHHAGYGLFLFGAPYIEVNTALNHATPFFIFAVFVALAWDLMGLKTSWPVLLFVWANIAIGSLLLFVWIGPLHQIALAVSGLGAIAITPLALVLAVRGSRNARNFFLANLASVTGGSFALWSQLAGMSALDFTFAIMMYGNAITGLLVVLLLALRYRDLVDNQVRLREQEFQSRQAALENEAIARAKSAFLATMSHEIRTPMNGVLGLASLLNNTALEPVQRDYLRSIERSGKSLVAILDDILDYSKFEQGNVELEALEIDLVELVEDVMLGVQHRCKSKDLVLKIRFDRTAPEFVIGDPTRIRQVLNNLVGNAIKFTQTGYVELSVWMEGATTLFAVRDTGIGIPTAQLPLLFERFQQADRCITRQYGGTGLGLAISRLLVRAMGGEILVQSQEGVGSEFKVSVSIPLADRRHCAQVDSLAVSGSVEAVAAAQWFVDRWSVQLVHVDELAEDVAHCEWPLKLTAIRRVACGIAAEQNPSKLVSEPLAGLRVLVAEDNPVNQIVIEKHLENLGAEVCLVENGELALECLLSARYDLVLMDCEMPLMDGYTATRTFRENQQSELPIIALTAHAGEEHRRQALEAGMDGYLTKPITPAELVNTILQHVVCSVPSIPAEVSER